jgi:hypothetical protein
MSASDVGPGLSPLLLKANSDLSRCLLAPPLLSDYYSIKMEQSEEFPNALLSISELE